MVRLLCPDVSRRDQAPSMQAREFPLKIVNGVTGTVLTELSLRDFVRRSLRGTTTTLRLVALRLSTMVSTDLWFDYHSSTYND